ncbi:transposase [Streptomyces sp. NPDC056479]|uniref:transposase n=1 Tax=Streptomyces sp. NPDC056479 TaxID=3345832 RepID=UPI0036842F80
MAGDDPAGSFGHTAREAEAGEVADAGAVERVAVPSGIDVLRAVSPAGRGISQQDRWCPPPKKRGSAAGQARRSHRRARRPRARTLTRWTDREGHLAVEHGQKPLSFLATAGQRHGGPQVQLVLERIPVPRTGVGRPRCRPIRVRADRAYGSRTNRGYLRKRGIRCTIPEKSDQIRNRK